MAAGMTLHGTPNDLIQCVLHCSTWGAFLIHLRRNLNPISIIVMIPIFDKIIYPFLRRRHINFSPIKRIYAGFLVAGLGELLFINAIRTLANQRYACQPCFTLLSSRNSSTRNPLATTTSPPHVSMLMVTHGQLQSTSGLSLDRISLSAWPKSSLLSPPSNMPSPR